MRNRTHADVMTDSGTDRYEPLPGLLQLPGFLLRKVSRRTRVALLVGLVACVAVTVTVVVPAVRHSKRVAERQEQTAHRAAVLQARRRVTEDQRPRRARATSRAGAVGELQHAITRDARERFRRGVLPGPPVRATRCRPASEATPSGGRAGRRLFTCLALTSPSIGFEFVAVVDDRRHRLVWCKTNPPGATDAEPLATVPLAPVCLGR
jgi:hypothetical protein